MNQLRLRREWRFQYIIAPLLAEREAYLAECKRDGMSLVSLRQTSQYLLHLIKILHLEAMRTISIRELTDGAELWCQTEGRDNKKANTECSRQRFLRTGRRWFRFMDMLEPVDNSFYLSDKVDDYLDYLVDCKGYSMATRASRYSLLRNFMLHLEAKGIGLKEQSAPMLDGYICKRHDETWKARKTVAGAVSALKGFLQYAESKGWCRFGLPQMILSPKIGWNEDIPNYAPWDNVQKILRCNGNSDSPISIRNYAILLLLSVYGLIRGEVASLKLKDIDWHNSEIHLRRDKGRKTQVMPLLPKVGNALIRYLKEVRWNSRKQEHVFLGTVYPYKPLTAGGIYNFVKKNLKQEGIILKHYGAHCLRHSCATHVINSGHTMKEVADLLEHQNITTTAIYAKVDMKSLRKVADMSWEGLL